MKIELQQTDDGSNTLFLPEMNESYHSRHGAIRESEHVFIENGLLKALKKSRNLNILEIGMGTGLNVLLTALSIPDNTLINYTALEPFPIEMEILNLLNYPENLVNIRLSNSVFSNIHESEWDRQIYLKCNARFKKIKCEILKFTTEETYDLVYFDAFAPGPQPEMWKEEVFKHIFSITKIGGILTTYCSKGDVRRTLQKVGFQVEKLAGPPGKREMLRAIK